MGLRSIGRRPWGIAVGAVVGVLVVLVALTDTGGDGASLGGVPGASRVATGSGEEISVPFPEQGSLARDFVLPRLETEAPWMGPDRVRLSDYAGRWVYLDVFGSWCLPCRRKYPKMRAIAREMEREGAVMLGLLFEDDPETAARWLSANGGMPYPFAVLDEETARAWQLTGAPMGFLISPEGRIVKVCYGCSRGRDAVELLPELVR
ncbi:MAG: TlpA disulfide reductase family protein [Longimicrobiales bacterium]|nr:TlpA disulfide reductase family protein [Longimicrobiales bacterium]